MGQTTKIQWTDHTFNPWIGCARVAPGCVNCYAEADMDRRRGRVVWGPHGTRSRTSDDYWQQPAKWNKQAEAAGVRQRVFCASLADVFEDWSGAITNQFGDSYHHGAAWNRKEKYIAIPDVHIGKSLVSMTDLRRDLFNLIDATPWLDWLLLTKRPENIIKMWPAEQCGDCHQAEQRGIQCGPCGGTGTVRHCRPNVWLGTSISEQATANSNIPALLRCRQLAPVLFLSAEPLLGPVNLRRVLTYSYGSSERWIDALDGTGFHSSYDGGGGCIANGPTVDWVIVGGESGPGARPCDQTWIRNVVEQCGSAGVPCFVKQMGATSLITDSVGETFPVRWTHDKKGATPSEWIPSLRVRQFPEVRRA